MNKAINGYCVIQAESIEYKSNVGVVSSGNVKTAGNGLKGTDIQTGKKVEFVRNKGTEVRKDVYAVKSEYVFFEGDLDQELENFKTKNNAGQTH